MRGTITSRTVEPMRLVHTGRRWYLAAWDIARNDWRTFRVDRIEAQPRLTEGPRFIPRQPPVDSATLVQRSITSWPQPLRARVKLRGTLAELRRQLPSWVGTLETLDGEHCALTVGGDSAEMLAGLLLYCPGDFALLDSADAAKPLRNVAERLLRAIA